MTGVVICLIEVPKCFFVAGWLYMHRRRLGHGATLCVVCRPESAPRIANTRHIHSCVLLGFYCDGGPWANRGFSFLDQYCFNDVGTRYCLKWVRRHQAAAELARSAIRNEKVVRACNLVDGGLGWRAGSDTDGLTGSRSRHDG